MTNPFYIKELPVDAAFCNRTNELHELTRYAMSKNDVVIHSPRRFGKTSLVKRVQIKLAGEGAITVFVDFFGVSSVEEVAARMAESVFTVTRQHDSLFKKAMRTLKVFRPVMIPDDEKGVKVTVEPTGGVVGIKLLKETMSELGEFIKVSKKLVHIALDEFQEIVGLPDCHSIESVLRTEIAKHGVSYFYVGSQRRILRAMFSDRQRPFFDSAFDYTLKPLPMDELAEFVVERFADAGVVCSEYNALKLAKLVDSFPYYAQKLAYFVFERSLADKTVSTEAVDAGFRDMMFNERAVFESIMSKVPAQQRRFLKAIAMEPTHTPYSHPYMRKHNLGSVSAIQNAVKQLDQDDLIEQDVDKRWKITDPVFRIWLSDH